MGDGEFIGIQIFWVTVEFATFARGRAIIFEFAIIFVSKHFSTNFFVHSYTTGQIKIIGIKIIFLRAKPAILQRLL